MIFSSGSTAHLPRSLRSPQSILLTGPSDLSALVGLIRFFIAIVWILSNGFRNDAVNASFERLFLQEKAVLVPNEVRDLRVELVAFHAAFEQAVDVLVVGICRECKASAVVHVLFEFRRLVEAEFVDSDLLLLSFDVVIFFVLRPARETLPRERAA